VESRRVVVDEGRGDFYIYGWTHRKKKNNKRTREGTQKKKERKNDVTRERYTHIDAFCVFLLFFKYHFNTQTYARATPTPAKTKTKKKTSDVAALNENLRKERTYTQIYLAFILRRFLVNIFFVNYRLDIFILSKREKPVFQLKKKKKIVMYIGLYINYPDLRLPNRCFHHLLSSLLFKC
jgi:hypothetical protein